MHLTVSFHALTTRQTLPFMNAHWFLNLHQHHKTAFTLGLSAFSTQDHSLMFSSQTLIGTMPHIYIPQLKPPLSLFIKPPWCCSIGGICFRNSEEKLCGLLRSLECHFTPLIAIESGFILLLLTDHPYFTSCSILHFALSAYYKFFGPHFWLWSSFRFIVSLIFQRALIFTSSLLDWAIYGRNYSDFCKAEDLLNECKGV